MRRAGETQPHAAAAVFFIDAPFRSRIDRHAGFARNVAQLHGVDIVGQLHPKKDAARRIIELGRGAELLVERGHQRVELGAEALPQLLHVAGEVRLAIFGQHHLLEPASAGIGLERQHAREDRPRRHHKAEPQRRRDRLRERADMDDVLRLAQRIDRRRALAVPCEVGVAIVLDDRHAILLASASSFLRRSSVSTVAVGFCTVAIV